jgi:hypothetical protein
MSAAARRLAEEREASQRRQECRGEEKRIKRTYTRAPSPRRLPLSDRHLPTSSDVPGSITIEEHRALFRLLTKADGLTTQARQVVDLTMRLRDPGLVREALGLRAASFRAAQRRALRALSGRPELRADPSLRSIARRLGIGTGDER